MPWCDVVRGSLRDSYERYKHLLHGGSIDVDLAEKIEDIEKNIINNIKNIIDLDKDLEEIIRELTENGVLDELIRDVGRELKVNVKDARKAVNTFLDGNLQDEQARIAFIVIQAVARLKAMHSEQKGLSEKARITPYCPVCGAESGTMVRYKGAFYMVCPFCGFMWRVSDTFICPYCGNTDKLRLGVMTGKRSKRLGIAWCQECGRTWRVILDERVVLSVPRLLLPVIAYGAEIYREALSSVMDDESSGGE